MGEDVGDDVGDEKFESERVTEDGEDVAKADPFLGVVVVETCSVQEEAKVWSASYSGIAG